MSGIPAKIGHRVDAGRELVLLRVLPNGASIHDDFELTYSQAKRLAWALLADLCPDELEADPPLEEEALRTLGAIEPDGPYRPCNCHLAGRRAPSGKGGQILAALARGGLTAREAGAVIDRDTSTGSSFLVHLVRYGLAEPVSGGMFGAPTVYGITDLGREARRNGRFVPPRARARSAA